ncbi:MAG: patatin-like phospholipase family protein, partial [Oscillospiraceae bacterium]|nr:patatin-like phospholipase family protein [Oscillospiraceae bacterium]
MKLKLDHTKEYALALEGGGAKGAYQIGVWQALREAGIKIKAVAGTSVGALNGAMM